MQPTTSAQALTGLQSAQAAAQDPNSILQQQQQQLGVNGAQQTVSGLRGAIDNTTKLLNQVAPSIMGRTANSLVTNAQATKQISNEQAPISQNLSQENTDLNQQNTNLQDLEQKAQTAATGIYQGQQDKLSYAQNLYNNLYKQEQDAQAQQNAQAAQQEQIRQFNADLAAKTGASSSGSGIGNVLGTLFGGGSSSSPSSNGAQAQQRTGGGFNFQNANGQAINATAYSQAKGIPIRTQLQSMANEGDSGAKTALDYVGNDYGVNMAKLNALSGNTKTSTTNILRALGFNV